MMDVEKESVDIMLGKQQGTQENERRRESKGQSKSLMNGDKGKSMFKGGREE